MKFTLNGLNYELVETYPKHIVAYCEIGGKWTELTRTFSDWEEVEEWKDKMEHPDKTEKNWGCSDSEYDNTGKYYGD